MTICLLFLHCLPPASTFPLDTQDPLWHWAIHPISISITSQWSHSCPDRATKMSQSLNHPKTTRLDLCWCFPSQGHLYLNPAWEWCSVGVGDESNAPLATGGVKLKGRGGRDMQTPCLQHQKVSPVLPQPPIFQENLEIWIFTCNLPSN